VKTSRRSHRVAATPLPVVAHYWPDLGASDLRRVRESANRIRSTEPRLADVGYFSARVRPGWADYPTLHIHDANPTITVGAPRAREHRAFLLATHGDLVVTGTEAVPGFVEHCSRDLGFGDVDHLVPAALPKERSLAVRCIQDRALIERVVALARRSGGLNVAPYISTGGIWALAGILSNEARVPVYVASPPPRLAERVNNKVWFSRTAEHLLGADALPPSIAAHSWTFLAHLVRRCARKYVSVGIKLPSDAGSAGNLVLDSGDLAKYPTLRELRLHLKTIFAGLGWTEPFPALVSVWEQSVLRSPSVQMWVPSRPTEDVVVEGVFDQRVEGSVCRFVGCEPSDLGEAVRDRLAHEAALLGTLFRDLGYFGRCSLDSIVVGESEAVAKIHWVECNGRWGGTSIPMTLGNRLVGDWAEHPIAVLGGLEVTGDHRFSAIRERARDLLFEPSVKEGLVFLSPGPAETGRGLDFMAVGASPGHARTLLHRGVDLLAGPSKSS
jgi:hypothetical protein